MSQFCLNVCTWIEAAVTNGRKQVLWDDVTKHFPIHKAAIITNLLNSFQHWDTKHAIK